MMEISLYKQKLLAMFFSMMFVFQISMITSTAHVEAWSLEETWITIKEYCGGNNKAVSDVFKQLQETSHSDPFSQLAENTPTQESMIQGFAQKWSSYSGQTIDDFLAEAKRIVEMRMSTQIGANDQEGSADNTIKSTIDADEITDIGDTTITDTTYQNIKNMVSTVAEEKEQKDTALSSMTDSVLDYFGEALGVATNVLLPGFTGTLGALSTSVAYAGTPSKREDEEDEENETGFGAIGRKTGEAIFAINRSQMETEYSKLSEAEKAQAELASGGSSDPVPQAIISSADNHKYESVYKTNFAEAVKYGAQLVFPADGVITSPWGDRIHPIFGTVKHHSGVDIGLDEGTPLGAARDGKIIYSGWIEGYGYTIEIDHGNGLTTLYGHNSALNVKVGDYVRAGDIIAYAGSTGYSTGPHCHFEVRINDQDVDPFSLLGNYKQFMKNQ